MKILLTGKEGQVGHALHRRLTTLCDVIATGRDELDLNDHEKIISFIDKIQPTIIINAAAYTEVDKAENDFQSANQINTEAPRVFAEKANELGIPLIHFSTDYVFDGLKKEPYNETDSANPQSIYGITKWSGEEAVRKNKQHIILRTSWVFSSHGSSFLKTILKNIQQNNFLSIVYDQKGTPTSANILSNVTYKIIVDIMTQPIFRNYGTYNVSASGVTNWYQYACFITDEAIRLGLKTSMTSRDIRPIKSIEFPSIAKRPMNSSLNTQKIKNTFMIDFPNWECEVRSVLKEII